MRRVNKQLTTTKTTNNNNFTTTTLYILNLVIKYFVGKGQSWIFKQIIPKQDDDDNEHTTFRDYYPISILLFSDDDLNFFDFNVNNFLGSMH